MAQSSSVTRVTINQRLDLVLFHQFSPLYELIEGRFPIDTKHGFTGTEVLFGLPMTVHTPAHLQCRVLPRQRHVADRTVTGGAPHAFVNVDAVVEVHELR